MILYVGLAASPLSGKLLLVRGDGRKRRELALLAPVLPDLGRDAERHELRQLALGRQVQPLAHGGARKHFDLGAGLYSREPDERLERDPRDERRVRLLRRPPALGLQK